MSVQLPEINEMTTIEASSWYTKQVAEITNPKNRIAGTYLDEFKQALIRWKGELSRRVLAERNGL
ncbi:MAG: hypothetical protein E6778_06680 [Niallia nealsonii]|nr:hypothetical protein [Niallia nealsonii]